VDFGYQFFVSTSAFAKSLMRWNNNKDSFIILNQFQKSPSAFFSTAKF